MENRFGAKSLGGNMGNIQKQMQNLFGSACLAYSLAYIYDEQNRGSIKALTLDVVKGWEKGYIDDDAFVSKPIEYVRMLGAKVNSYNKVKIQSLNDLPSEGLYAVQYAYGNNSHFVVCRKGAIVFDSWENSSCVRYGKPISYRVLA